MNTQFKKGVLELCVLAVVAKKDTYGYELVQEISREMQIAEGTVYPLLRRLTSDGYFTTYLMESSDGPPRKYYQLTASGEKYREQLTREWQEFSAAVGRILGRKFDFTPKSGIKNKCMSNSTARVSK